MKIDISDVERSVACDVKEWIPQKTFQSKMLSETFFMDNETFIESEAKEEDKVPLSLKVMFALYSKLTRKLGNYKFLGDTKGDVTKLPNYKYIKDFLENTKRLDSSSTYLNDCVEGFKFLESKRGTLTKMYKTKHPGIELYESYTLALLMMVDVVIGAVRFIVQDGKGSIDYIVNDKKDLKGVANDIHKVLNMKKELNDIIKLDVSKDVKMKLVAESTIPHSMIGSEDMLDRDMMVEATVISVASVFAYGLSKTLYALLAPVRFVVYYAYRIKYSIENTTANIKDMLAYYAAESDAKRESVMNAMDMRSKVNNSQYEIAKANKDVKEELRQDMQTSTKEAEDMVF